MFNFFTKKKKKQRRREQVNKIFTCALVMLAGIALLKYIPMAIWGDNIQFDASFHITATFFMLYVVWFFIDQNPQMHFPFFLLSILILYIVSIQRIAVGAHNDIGLLLGLILSLGAIAVAEQKNLEGKFDF